MKTHHSPLISRFLALALVCAVLTPPVHAGLNGLKVLRIDSKLPRANGKFGSAVAVSSRFAVIGEPAFDVMTPKKGIAYVHDANTGAFLRSLTSTNSALNDNFGAAVALEGQLALIGAPNLVAPYVALFDVATGRQLKVFTDAAATVSFGTALALDGNYVLVGDSLGNFVCVFDKNTGVLLWKLTGEVLGDRFGNAVVSHDGLAAVGAPNNSSSKGAVYRYDLTTGVKLGKLAPGGLVANDKYGTTLAISGHDFLVSAPGVSPGSGKMFDGEMDSNGSITLDYTAALFQDGELGFKLAFDRSLEVATTGSRRNIALRNRYEGIVYSVFDGNEFGALTAPTGLSLSSNRLLIGCGDEGATAAGATFLLSNLPIPDDTTVLAQRGTPAPGAAGIFYNTVTEVATCGSYQSVMTTSLSGAGSHGNTDTAAILPEETGLTLLLQSHDALGGGVTVGSVFGPLSNYDGASTSFFQSTLTGTGVTSLNNRAVLVDNNGVSVILRTGSSLNLGGMKTLASFGTVCQRNDWDEIATNITLRTGIGGVTATSDSGCIVMDEFGAIVDSRLEGQAVAPLAGVTYGQFAARSSFTGFWVAYCTALSGAATSNQAVFEKRAGNMEVLVARKGDAAPGAGGAVFSAFLGETGGAPALIRATLSGTGVTSLNNEGLWFKPAMGLTLLARKGEQVPHLATGVLWSRFITAWPMHGNYMVRAQVRGAGITAANDEGVFLRFSNGTWMTLLREGDIAPGCEGERILGFQRVEGEIKGDYYAVLATITGSATSNQAVFQGYCSHNPGNGQASNRPVLALRKGDLLATGIGLNSRIISLASANDKTQDATGMGNKGMANMVGTDGDVIVRATFSDGSVRVIRTGERD